MQPQFKLALTELSLLQLSLACYCFHPFILSWPPLFYIWRLILFITTLYWYSLIVYNFLWRLCKDFHSQLFSLIWNFHFSRIGYIYQPNGSHTSRNARCDPKGGICVFPTGNLQTSFMMMPRYIIFESKNILFWRMKKKLGLIWAKLKRKLELCFKLLHKIN